LPEGKEVAVEEGRTLLDAARAANVYVGAICGGEGTCGKCRLIVREGEVAGESTEFLTREEIRRGYILACQVLPQGDLVVEVPPESRLSGYLGIGKDSERFRDFAYQAAERPQAEGDPLVRKFFLPLPEPSLDDPRADQERLLDALARHAVGSLQMGLKVVRELPQILRRRETNRSRCTWTWDGRVTATVGGRGDVSEVLCVEHGDTHGRNFGLALDVGTTTVVAHLVDLVTGTTREAAAKYNSQIQFGADVISRIQYARQPGASDELRRAIVQDIDTLIEDLVQRSRVGRGEIHSVVAAGNTTMLHFLLGLEADLIRLSPFVPAAASPPPVRAAEVGVRVHPRAILYTMPMVGSFVGGDVTAGILASGMHRSDKLSLLLDLGTNGEVVLGNKDFLVACSASAGPAFEGGSVTCGMRATLGAVDSIRILQRGRLVSVTTIDDGPPLGLCGTGLIDAIAQMLLEGVVDRSGRFRPAGGAGRLRTSPDSALSEFVLVSAEEGASCRDVVISQVDIENLIRTKGAIYAAADSLVQSLGLTFNQIDNVYIAGGFGNRLDLSSCVTIGLLPDLPRERFHFIGNSSVAGAKLVLWSHRLFDEVNQICGRVTYRELMVDPAYMERFTSACFLPHTDLSRFPTAADQTPGPARPPKTPVETPERRIGP
jgi:uncharacterized 2Fe-2S/4Fe-4S cluster protein (DUF4445 family)